MTQQTLLPITEDNPQTTPISPTPSVLASLARAKPSFGDSSQYNVEYIKNHWAKDCYIFDLRWYQNGAMREEVLERVKNNQFENAGHSSFLLPLMKSHGWTDDQITDYLMTLKTKHLVTHKTYAFEELERMNLEHWSSDRIIPCYERYANDSKAIQEQPIPLQTIINKMKDQCRTKLQEEKRLLNEKIQNITEKLKQLERSPLCQPTESPVTSQSNQKTL